MSWPTELLSRVPEIVQTYVDSLVHKVYSTRYVNAARAKVFFPDRGYPTDDSRKRQLTDMVKVLGFSEDKIKRIDEALAKYEHVDEAVEMR